MRLTTISCQLYRGTFAGCLPTVGHPERSCPRLVLVWSVTIWYAVLRSIPVFVQGTYTPQVHAHGGRPMQGSGEVRRIYNGQSFVAAPCSVAFCRTPGGERPPGHGFLLLLRGCLVVQSMPGCPWASLGVGGAAGQRWPERLAGGWRLACLNPGRRGNARTKRRTRGGGDLAHG